jgi:hypothetical protein
MFSRHWILKAAFGTILFCSTVLAANPFIHSIFTADPSGHVWADGRMYVYASHDIDPNQGCDLMDKYHVFSSADLVNWLDEGEILRASQVPWGRQEGGFMWAPDCAYKNGTYYFYFPHPSGTDWGSTWKIGVATSSHPASGFTCQGYIPNLDPLIDPAVFVDDDGSAYFYQGGGGTCKGGKLKENMMEIDGAMQAMQGLKDFHEATWVHKRNGIYYLSYADNHSDATGDNQMAYATGANPLGPWTYRGIVMRPTDSYCAHGSIVQFKDQWYVLYFNSAVSGNDWLRSICIDKLNYNADGTIQEVAQTTTGAPAAGTEPPVPVLGTYEAENGTVAGGATVASDPAASGGKSVQNLHLANSSLTFGAVNGGEGGRGTVHVYYAATTLAKIRLFVNDTDFSLINLPATSGWNDYSGHSYLTVPLKAGQTNTIKITGGNGGANIDYVKVTGFNNSAVQASPVVTRVVSTVGRVWRAGSGAQLRIGYSLPEHSEISAGIVCSIFDVRGSLAASFRKQGKIATSGALTVGASAANLTTGLYTVRISTATTGEKSTVLASGIITVCK